MHLSVTKSFIVYVNKGAKVGPTPCPALTDLTPWHNYMISL